MSTKTNYLGLTKPDTEDIVDIRVLNNNADIIDQGMQKFQEKFGSITVVETAAEMTDKDKVYVYAGSESGYKTDYWYYYKDGAWKVGRPFNSNGIKTDANLEEEGIAADAAATGRAVGELKESKIDYTDLSIFDKHIFKQTQIDANGFEIASLKGFCFKKWVKVKKTGYYLCTFRDDLGYCVTKNDFESKNSRNNIQIKNNIPFCFHTDTTKIELYRVENGTRVEMDNGDLEKSEFSLEYVGYLNSFTIKANTDSNLQSYNVDIKKGQKFKIKADKCNFLSVSLSDSFPFDNNTLYRLIADKTVDGNYVSDIFTAEKDYKGIKFYSHEDCDIKLNLLSDNESDIWEELNRKENTREIKLNFTNFAFDANGTLGIIERENCLSTQKLNQAGLYIITFPDELKCSYNATYIDDSRFNCDAYCPFSISINENDFTRLKFMKKDDSRLSNNDEILKNVHVYLCENVSNNIKIAASNSHINDKNNADFVCDGQNDTEILCALFCCMNDLGINLMDGIYSINKMWTYKDKSKIAISLNTYSYDGSTGYRRYILMQGRTRTSPQDVGGVKLKVTKELHEKLSNDDSNIMIGAPYQINGDEIQRIATSCVLLNFNIIGYKYDKEITYVDTTRCLSQMIESVNVRSWEKNINSYDAFEDTPNLDCTGIRVGRGSNYGIQNCVKNLNVWYCGKGIACNGEHFTFEDVKAHHDYVGFYFGDRKTVGKMEHTNVMINCSIESCKRLMILSKNGIAEAMDNDGSIPKSTLLIYGLSTENQWQIPTNEIVNERQENMLGIKEIVKNCYRGIILADWDGKIFEDGSGGNFETKVY